LIVFVFLPLASFLMAPKKISPSIPALKPYWSVLHVTFSLIGESFFALPFMTAIYYIFVASKDNIKKQKTLDRVITNFIAIGYPIFTALVLIFGAIWTRYILESFYSCNPKKTWTLITWFIYIVYLHARFLENHG